MVDAIEVTEEQKNAGLRAWRKCHGTLLDALAVAYRAMRALEPGAKPTVQELSDGRVRPLDPWEIQRLVAIQGTDIPIPKIDVGQKSSPDSNDGLTRRLDAIEAFVRHLATGYNSRNDDYLQVRRLIDALDASILEVHFAAALKPP